MSGKTNGVLRKIVGTDWSYLAKGVVEYNVLSHFKPLAPTVMTAVVNYRCNARCAMCNIWQSPRRHEMTVDEFAKVMADPLFDNVERLTVVGGEATLRADLVDLTRMFVERLPRLRSLSTISNGFLPERIFANTEAMLALTEPRNIGFSISISLEGLGTEHDKVRGVDGAFEKVQTTLAGLKKMQDQHKFWMGVGYTLMHQNLGQAREFRRWADERDIEIGFQPVGFHSSYVSNLDLQEDVDFRPEDRDESDRVHAGDRHAALAARLERVFLERHGAHGFAMAPADDPLPVQHGRPGGGLLRRHVLLPVDPEDRQLPGGPVCE